MTGRIGCTLGLVAVALWVADAPAQVVDRRPTMAVMYFNNNSLVDHATYDALSKGVADILLSTLASNVRVRVVERDQLQRILEEQDLVREGRIDPETSVRVGRLLGAQHMIVGGFLLDRGGTIALDARIVHVESGRVLHGETAEGKADDLLSIIRKLASTIFDRLALGEFKLPDRDDRRAENRWTSLLTYSRALVEDDKKNVAPAIVLYERFLRETPATFAGDQRKRAVARLAELKGGGE